MELLTNDEDLETNHDPSENSLPCFLQYAVKMLVVSSVGQYKTKFGVGYWSLGRTAKVGLTSSASLMALDAKSLSDAHKAGRLRIEQKQDTVVLEIGRLLKLCS